MFKKTVRFFAKIAMWFIIVSIGLVLLFKWVPVPITPLMVIRYFEKDSPKILKHDWEPIENISKNLQLAVICSEDQNFLKHNGFDIKAIEKAYENNKKGKLNGPCPVRDRWPAVPAFLPIMRVQVSCR